MKHYGVETEEMSVRQINKLFRANDESHLWPVCNKFNATDRAIRRLAKTGECFDDYAAALDTEISQIVNSI
jgi:hypothetical protein